MNQKSLTDLSVLVADDNPINQTIFGKMIRNLGCYVEVAGDGRSVLKLLKEEGEFYDLIFLDIQMPDMDGFELTKHIRDFQKNTSKKSKIIAVSGHATKYHIDKARDSGMDDYLTKPVKSSKIMEVCQKHMAATTKDTD